MYEDGVAGDYVDTAVTRSSMTDTADGTRQFQSDASDLHKKIRAEQTSAILKHKPIDAHVSIDSVTNLVQADEVRSVGQFVMGLIRDMQRKADEESSIDDAFCEKLDKHTAMGKTKNVVVSEGDSPEPTHKD